MMALIHALNFYNWEDDMQSKAKEILREYINYHLKIPISVSSRAVMLAEIMWVSVDAGIFPNKSKAELDQFFKEYKNVADMMKNEVGDYGFKSYFVCDHNIISMGKWLKLTKEKDLALKRIIQKMKF